MAEERGITDTQAKELAQDLVLGKYFMSDQMRPSDGHLLGMVFMPLLLMTDQQMEDLRATGAAIFYAPMSEAGPRVINGYPIFMKMKYLTKADYIQVKTYEEKIRAAMASVLEEPKDGREEDSKGDGSSNPSPEAKHQGPPG